MTNQVKSKSTTIETEPASMIKANEACKLSGTVSKGEKIKELLLDGL